MAILKVKTFTELLERLKQSSDDNFISEDNNSVKFSELAIRVESNIQNVFRQSGKRYFIYASHSIFFVEAFLSVTASGNIAIPINANLPLDKIENLKNKFKIDYVIKDITDLEKIKDLNINSAENNKTVNENSPGLALFTSGVTGESKAVLMSHFNIFSNAYSVIKTMNLEDPGNIAVILPLYHSFALITQLVTTLLTGGRIFFSSGFKFYAEMIDFIKNNQIETIAGVPTNFKLLLMGNQTNFSIVKHITIAGAALDLNLADNIKRFFPNADLWVGYGLTEAGPRVTAIKYSDQKFAQGSVGKAINGVTVQIKNEELIIQSPSIMLGYLDDSDNTQKKVIENVLYSGDQGRIDEEGYLYITGRKDDIFMSGGEKISPLAIEKALNQHPDIQFAAVFGEEDIFFGKKIIALIKTRDEKIIKSRELLLHCSKLLENHLLPHKFFKTENLPMTPNGKIKRKELHLCQKEKL